MNALMPDGKRNGGRRAEFPPAHQVVMPQSIDNAAKL
jgi:hypothetical protein